MGGQISLVASLVLTLLVLLPGKGWAQDNSFEDAETGLTYTVENNEATITGIHEGYPSSGELVIPAYFNDYQYPVKAIGDKAFMDNLKIKKVSFDDRSQLEKIGTSAFGRCEFLSEIKLPSSITTIERFAFECCRELTEIEIPSSVTAIGAGAFMDCDQLTKVTINSYEPVEMGYESIFMPSDNLTIYVPDVVVDSYKSAWSRYEDYIKPISEASGSGSSSVVVADNGFKLKLDEDNLTATIVGVTKAYGPLDLTNPVTYNGTQYTITAIGANAFMDCSFSVVKIPSSVTTIGEYAFAGAVGYFGTMKVYFAYDGEDLSGYASTAFTNFSGQDLFIIVPSTNVDAYKSSFQNQAANIYINRNEGEVTDDFYTGRGYYQAQTISYTRQLTEAEQNGGYVTCCLPFMIDASKYQDKFAAIYVIDKTITKKGDGRYYLTLKNMAPTDAFSSVNKVSPDQPMLLKLKSGVTEIKFTNVQEIFLGDKFDEYSTDMTVKDEDGTELTDLKVQLCGSKEKKTDCANIYSFNPDGTFGKHKYATLNPFRMYLNVTDTNGSSVQSAAFYSSINPGDGTTAISGIQTGATQKTAAIYSIDGKKVSDNGSTASLAKGVYIQNGKKIVVK